MSISPKGTNIPGLYRKCEDPECTRLVPCPHVRCQEHRTDMAIKDWIVRHKESWLILAYKTITQDTCPHDAKVKLAGYSGIYECTRCHKFIRTAVSWIVVLCKKHRICLEILNSFLPCYLAWLMLGIWEYALIVALFIVSDSLEVFVQIATLIIMSRYRLIAVLEI